MAGRPRKPNPLCVTVSLKLTRAEARLLRAVLAAKNLGEKNDKKPRTNRSRYLRELILWRLPVEAALHAVPLPPNARDD